MVIKLEMQKNYFHNKRSIIKNSDKKKLFQSPNIDMNSVVDINILLNRVKIEKKIETKRKIIFFSLIALALTLLGTLLAIIK